MSGRDGTFLVCAGMIAVAGIAGACSGAGEHRSPMGTRQPAPSASLPDGRSASDAATPSAMDAGDAAVIPDASGADAASCSTAPNDAGVAVPIVQIAEAAPVASGGSIMPGPYVLTAVDVFTGSGGPVGATGDTVARRCSFSASTYGCLEKEGVSSPNAAVTPGTIQAGAHSEAATTITLTRECPTNPPRTAGYTATPTELQLFTHLPTATVRETMRRE
jgi:hypothetical protein